MAAAGHSSSRTDRLNVFSDLNQNEEVSVMLMYFTHAGGWTRTGTVHRAKCTFLN